ncbi:MAG: HAMP domain-containing histidine kinase [Ruminococcus sp.]|nr:HAMP domain-containing histidine kinase [Ruminococcus sp.]
MIKKLRRKFILITAVSLFSVLTAVVAAINIINSYQLRENEDELIAMISGGGGSFPDFFGRDGNPPDMKNNDQKNNDQKMGSMPKFDFRDRKSINEETRYQTRYFVVYYNEAGEIANKDMTHIAAVDSEKAEELAQEAKASGEETGTIGNYRYQICDGGTSDFIIFLDRRQNMETKQRFLLISIGISAASFVFVLGLIVLLSRRAVKPFIAAHEKQKQFITDASHEIKTPLAIISANTEVLEMTSEPSEWTESTKNQIKRLDGLVKDLMRLSKMDEAQEKKEFISFDLSEVVMKTAAEFEAPARTHGESFKLDIDEDILIVGDSASIAQTVGIFCDNAVKYCDEGGNITVSLKHTHKGVKLSVSNDCKEPPKGDLSRLFDRFYRADEARQRKGSGGYGIGLSIAKATADAHKAKISCSASEGRITFSITFKG